MFRSKYIFNNITYFLDLQAVLGRWRFHWRSAWLSQERIMDYVNHIIGCMLSTGWLINNFEQLWPIVTLGWLDWSYSWRSLTDRYVLHAITEELPRLPLTEGSKDKTSFVIHRGAYIFTKVAQGVNMHLVSTNILRFVLGAWEQTKHSDRINMAGRHLNARSGCYFASRQLIARFRP